LTPGGQLTEFSGLTTNSGPTEITSGPGNKVWWTENTANNIGTFGWIQTVTQPGVDPTQQCGCDADSSAVPFGPAFLSPQDGNVRVELPYDLGQGGAGAFATELAYDSDSVSVQPI